jgi:hypothetical protein
MCFDHSAALNLPDAVCSGIHHALTLIRTRYDCNEDPANDMSFHCAAHTVGVIRRTGTLLRAMQASAHDFHLGLLAAAFHDTVQNWASSARPDGRVLRGRFAGRNELDSAAEAVAWMRRAGVFCEENFDLVTRAILGTIPDWDVVHQTVSQPNLTHAAPVVVRAVALADLGIAGMDGRPFLETGDRLFREENLDIDAALRRCPTRFGLGSTILEGYKARMLAWTRSQPAFARGSRALLEHDLGNLRGAAREAVRGLFCKFEAAITTAEEAVRVRESLSPWEVARAMGYPVPGVAGIVSVGR